MLAADGSGKTSFLNLAREHLKQRVTILEFNPWMFSGTQQFALSFFTDISAQFKKRKGYEAIAQVLANYGEIVSGMSWALGPWAGIGGLAKLLMKKPESAESLRPEVLKLLAQLDKPVVVVLDDIDRLTAPEIRDIFKLVRLTANFPRLVYVLMFDRLRVEQALSEQGFFGATTTWKRFCRSLSTCQQSHSRP